MAGVDEVPWLRYDWPVSSSMLNMVVYFAYEE